MSHKLHVLVPGIRTKNWKRLYDSVGASFSGDWEIIFAGPYPLPEELKKKKNVRFINDWGSPIRCQQMAFIEAAKNARNQKKSWVTWAADDGVFLPGALDVAFAELAQRGMDMNAVIMGKYFEGEGNDDRMSENHYYTLFNHQASRSKYLPTHYLMLNVGVVSLDLLVRYGGWDCQFEVCPMAYNDLAIRLQNGNVLFWPQDEIMFKCSHLPGHEGDHGPIHDGQVEHDQPLFKALYSTPDCRGRMAIDIDNYLDAPDVWRRRFK